MFSSCKQQILDGGNNLLVEHKSNFYLSDLQSTFSSQTSSRLNGFFTSTGLKAMLEEKDYDAIDAVFTFAAAFIDRGTGY